MQHSRDTHERALNSLCRICGETALKTRDKKHYRKSYFIDETLSHDLTYVLEIKTIESIHSKYVCHKCHRQLGHCKKKESVMTKHAIKDKIAKSEHIWQPFDIIAILTLYR